MEALLRTQPNSSLGFPYEPGTLFRRDGLWPHKTVIFLGWERISVSYTAWPNEPWIEVYAPTNGIPGRKMWYLVNGRVASCVYDEASWTKWLKGIVVLGHPHD